MSDLKEITKEEFKNINEIQVENSQNLNQLGVLEFQIQKLTLEKSIITTKIESTEQKFQDELKKVEKKYGNINLDLSTGKFTETEKNQETITK
jgi:hypothetical protein